MSKVVLDASALLAFLRRESGSERVREVLVGSMISTISLAEVLTIAAKMQSEPGAARRVLRALPIRTVPLDTGQATIAAELPLPSASLEIRCALALGIQREAIVLTADASLSETVLGVAVEVIR